MSTDVNYGDGLALNYHQLLSATTRFEIACENIPFSSLFAAGDVSRETSPAAKSEEKRMFSQASFEKA